MNNLLLSLVMAAMGQLGGMGPGPLLPGAGLPRGFAPFPPAPVGGGAALPLTTLAVVECLGQTGRIDGRQARDLLMGQGRSHGWPRRWPAAFSRRQVAATIRGAGGCRRLLTGQRRGGGIARRPVLPAPVPAPRRMPVPAGPPSSEREGFGLAPYR